ncbi:MAG: ABC transporter permease, partial [Terracidiphilus sp.]
MRNPLHNLRFSLRMLRKSPGLTLTVVLTLAFGIGATTAIFTVVYATLIAPMPYPNPDQLVIVWSKIQTSRNVVSAGDFLDWKREATAFQDLVALSDTSFNLAGKEAPEIVQAQYATPGTYRMMGVRFQLGRGFLPEEGVDGRDRVV